MLIVSPLYVFMSVLLSRLCALCMSVFSFFLSSSSSSASPHLVTSRRISHRFPPSLLTMLQLLLITTNAITRLIYLLYMIIPDCDETYNYWEPLNLLVRGFGKQTWEYSPEFAIRSYAYLLPYYIATYPINILLNIWHLPSYYNFYFIRLVILAFTVSGELKLYFSLKRNIGFNVAFSYLLLSTVSTGLAHAGVELLPSSFAMQCITISTSYALDPVSVSSAVSTLTWIMIGGLVGWPFCLVLAIPYGVIVLFKSTRLFLTVSRCVVNLLTVLAVIITVDSFFYQRLVLIPLNIVLYNVFGGEGEGPEIFGVEPFSYYILNLVLNFNVVAILGYIGILWFKPQKNYFVISMPLLIWSIVFFSQPHKEERFLYPVYSLIMVNSAVVVSDGGKIARKFVGANITKFAIVLFYIGFGVVSLLRTTSLVENYQAPLVVAKHLAPSSTPVNVCIGREWYHFPNSFFLPDNHRLRFVKSGFDGLLPRDFEEHVSLFEATSFVPQDMNNKNMFVESTVIPFEQCHYYIDNSGATNGIEPEVFGSWNPIYCHKLLNPDGDNGVSRLIYVPAPLKQKLGQVEYMELCLLN